MTAAVALAPWHENFPGLLTGSIYAVAPADRTAIACVMTEAGLGVHVDVMAESEGLPAGVSLAELSDIVAAVGPSHVDVHLIGSAEFVDTKLLRVLQLRPARVFLPWDAFTERRADALRAAGSSPWITLWQEWDGVVAPPWPASPDGVLVMLIEPGTTDRCRIDRLGIVTACASENPGIPVVVDGGITEDIAPLCVTAGVESMVVGRALLPGSAPGKEERP
jgi:pentose-5-phosphate-3-epimerase